MEARYNLMRVVNGVPLFARVTVEVDPGIDDVRTSEKARRSDHFDREEWFAAAEVGSKEAIEAHVRAGGPTCGVLILSVMGAEVDTNSAAVRAASFCATWKALGRAEETLDLQFGPERNVTVRVR